MSFRVSMLVAAGAVAWFGCGAMEPGPDAGETDSGVPFDAGQMMTQDAGGTDAGPVDAGVVDAGLPDAGIDGGAVDAGTTDAGVMDAGTDAGTIDAGVVDAGVMLCVPFSTQSCYDGPAGTSGVGQCVSGTRTCAANGLSYGACQGQTLPAASENCATSVDDNCNGTINEGCSAATTYTNDVRPIFQAKCSPCHTGNGSGGHNMGTSYADTQLNSYYCPGKTKGACALVRIQDGTMPAGHNCGPGSTDPGCVTSSEQATIQAWITGGQLQ